MTNRVYDAAARRRTLIVVGDGGRPNLLGAERNFFTQGMLVEIERLQAVEGACGSTPPPPDFFSTRSYSDRSLRVAPVRTASERAARVGIETTW
jgi:hypothetical protein